MNNNGLNCCSNRRFVNQFLVAILFSSLLLMTQQIVFVVAISDGALKLNAKCKVPIWLHFLTIYSQFFCRTYSLAPFKIVVSSWMRCKLPLRMPQSTVNCTMNLTPTLIMVAFSRRVAWKNAIDAHFVWPANNRQKNLHIFLPPWIPKIPYKFQLVDVLSGSRRAADGEFEPQFIYHIFN